MPRAMLTATVEGFEWRRCRLLLEQVEGELARLNVVVGDWETGQFSLAYETGAGQAETRLRSLTPQPPSPSSGPAPSPGKGESVPRAFSTQPREPLKALAAEVAGRRSQFVGAILRQSSDYLRELATGELAKGLGIGDSPYDVGRAIWDGSIRRLLDGAPARGGDRALQQLAEGIDRACGVVYSDGSVHSLHAYGEMSARTGTLAALNEGSMQRYASAGIHLVKASEHGTLCFLCQPFEGCVFALDSAGEDAGYPRANFTLPRHPNCRHSWGPYLESAFGPGKKLDPAVAAMGDRELYARMRDDVPRGKELMEAARRGFRNRAEYDRLKAKGEEFGPRYRRAGIEARRIEATRRVLESGGRLSYSQAMGQVTGEAAKAEGRGIFAGKPSAPKRPLGHVHAWHEADKVRHGAHHKPMNTVAESWVDMNADIEAINRGEGVRDGSNWRVNGRLYGVHGDKKGSFPIEGPGLHQLDRLSYKALMWSNRLGLTPEAEAKIAQERIGPEQRDKARALYELELKNRDRKGHSAK